MGTPSLPASEQTKLFALLKMFHDPEAWFDSLSYQEQILCKGWLTTGNPAFGKALLHKMLPSKPLDLVNVVATKRINHLKVPVAKPFGIVNATQQVVG